MVDTLAAQLALEYCYAKTQMMGLVDRIQAIRDERLGRAVRADGLESGNRRRGPSTANSRWLGARYKNNLTVR